jgi:hypothetical protein
MLRDGRDPLLLQKISFGEPNNFGHLTFWSPTGGFGDVHQYLDIGDEWFEWLLDIQPKDQTWNGQPVTRQMQANWLFAEVKGRPYFLRDGRKAFGHCLVPSQPVRIKTDSKGDPIITRFDNVRFQDGIVDNVPMVEVDPFTPELKNKPVQWLLEQAYVQRWTAITPNGTVNYAPRGVLYNPVWDWRAWRSNSGAKFIPLIYLK